MNESLKLFTRPVSDQHAGAVPRLQPHRRSGLASGNPTLCGRCPPSHPILVSTVGDLLCFVLLSAYMLDISVYYLFLQYFDTVGWVF